MTLLRPEFPFTAVAGQADFKKALILAAIDPSIGGVLVSGPRGVAKSTLARGLADILPPLPNLPALDSLTSAFVTLPLGASEEMLIGTLSLQKVLEEQQVAFSPGLLAKANGGVLYVDEVNLLNDGLVDQLLDVCASGVNCVERDGISHEHETRFILLGTMNPDEGELRPQLEDRFGLSVILDNDYSIEDRIDIVERRLLFDEDPQGYAASWSAEQATLRECIASARNRLDTVQFSRDHRRTIAERACAAGVDGIRADIVWAKAAIAHAAYSGRSSVLLDDIDAVEDLVLSHRRQIQPPTSPPEKNDGSPPEGESGDKPDSTDGHESGRSGSNRSNTNGDNADNSPQPSGSGDWGAMNPQRMAASAPRFLETLTEAAPATKRQNTTSALQQVWSRQAGRNTKGTSKTVADTSEALKVSWPATIVANNGRMPLQSLVRKPIEKGAQTLNLILLDTSASTLGKSVLSHAKGIVLGLLEQAYLARERVQILAFGNQQVSQVLAECRSPKQFQDTLNDVAAGGGTPLREALLQTRHHLERAERSRPGQLLKTWLVTDGRTNQSVKDIQLPGNVIVVDTESTAVKRGRGVEIAQALGADYLAI
ncbi:putative protein [BD1-7 clade bacterium]|uniref:Mg-protoporphyrin IX chelatase n=1 Tax=BD1-7 clade bacterium TaxID=2029982 RepID=A0A5S9PEE8_9GAMM|nr:putative protein [BD1-7 clade bacterium]